MESRFNEAMLGACFGSWRNVDLSLCWTSYFLYLVGSNHNTNQGEIHNNGWSPASFMKTEILSYNV
jgi:hypothetical protein